MTAGYFHRVHQQTPTRFWINNVTKEQAHLAIAAGAVGCTQNPAYSWKMITNPDEKGYVDEILKSVMAEYSDDGDALVALQRELVSGIAKIFYPIYESSKGKNGYVSIQGNPFREDSKSIVEYAHFNRQGGENIMVKIPVVETAFEAFEQLIKERVPINATECMAVRQVRDICEIYDKTTKNMVNPAPLYYSVITGIFDEHIKKTVEKENIDIPADYVYQAGMAVARKTYEMVKQNGYDCHYISGGARGLQHFTEMVGADAAITINWSGTADKLLELDQPVVSRFFNPTPQMIIDELCEKITDFRKAFFTYEIEPGEYEDFGPVVLFRSSFESAWKNATEYIAGLR